MPNDFISITANVSEPVPAAVWEFDPKESVLVTRAVGLQAVVNHICKSDTLPQLWLLCAHRALQPANRITRRAKLWDSLERRQLKMPPVSTIFENVIEDGGTLRGFGAAQLVGNNVENCARLMSQEYAALVVVTGGDAQWIQQLVESGWKCERFPFDGILSETLRRGAGLLQVYGEFDDRDVGAVFMARNEVMNNLRKLEN